MVRPSGAEDGYDQREQTIRPGTHVHGFGGKPHGIDADHRSNSRIHAASSAAAVTGHVTLMFNGPRLDVDADALDRRDRGRLGERRGGQR